MNDNLHENSLENNQIEAEENEGSVESEENKEHKDFNPYVGMRERLYKDPKTDTYNPDVEKAIVVLIRLLNIFTIATMWLFVFYFNLCLQSQTSTTNHAVFAVSAILAIIFTPIIPVKTKHGFYSQSFIVLISMVLLIFSTMMLTFFAIFVPLFIVILLTLVFVVTFLMFLIKESSFKIRDKIRIIAIIGLISFFDVMTLVKDVLL